MNGDYMQASDAPGVGLEPDMKILGNPLFTT